MKKRGKEEGRVKGQIGREYEKGKKAGKERRKRWIRSKLYN